MRPSTVHLAVATAMCIGLAILAVLESRTPRERANHGMQRRAGFPRKLLQRAAGGLLPGVWRWKQLADHFPALCAHFNSRAAGAVQDWALMDSPEA